MFKAIIKMGQTFVGSNNLPYFEGKGQFGTRNKGGKDAASERYIYVKPSWWLFLVYRKEDKPLLEIKIEEGHKAEPKTLLPTIPMIAINGASGMGTGWSTEIPCHHPLQVCDYLIYLINNDGKAKPNMGSNGIQPWYRGFKGTNRIVDKVKKTKATTLAAATGDVDDDTADAVNSEANELLGPLNRAKDAKRALVSTGCFHVEGQKVIITELPIGVWTNPYNSFLSYLYQQKIIGSKPRNLCDDIKVHFEIQGLTKPSYKLLKLKTKEGMTNMTVLDGNNKAVTYETIEQVIEAFYHFRLPYYYKRKENDIKQLEDKIKTLLYKIYFITLVNQNQLEVRNRSPAAIKIDLAKFEIPWEIYKAVPLHHLNTEEVDRLQAEQQKSEAELEQFKLIKPEAIWLGEIDQFISNYHKQYPDDVMPMTLTNSSSLARK